MLVYAKYHFAAVVFFTWVAGLFVDRSVPYFPIEISRTGTGPVSNLVFRWGMVAMIVTLWWENTITHLLKLPFSVEMLSSPLVVWPLMVAVAWYPDDSHLFIHLGALFSAMLLILLNVLLVGDVHRRLPIVLTALGIEGVRICLKGFVVLFTEFDYKLLDWRVYFRALFNVNGLRDEIIRHTMDIMYKGVEYASHPHLTIPMFRVTGVMQWTSLYLMACLY